MAPLRPLVQANTIQPESALDHNIPRLTLLFNNFQFSSWLLAAAVLQGLLTWLFPTAWTFIPAVIILGYRALDVLLIMLGYRSNPYMEGVITQKFSAQFPDANGDFGDKPSRKTVVVLLLGSKSNHPLGILYPGYLEVVKIFAEMVHDLEQNRAEYTYITSNSWISNNDPTVNAAREVMTVFYFESMDGLHRFAHGPIHRKGWDWWNRTIKQHSEISIMHEVYEAPAGCWENVYMNYRPSGFATGRFPVQSVGEGDKLDGTGGGEQQWIGNIVDASRMSMKSSKGRLGKEGNQ
ncbi:hypothetical protein BDW59DRAFT_174794 [Aspergillus cavernicola]|uniref:Monooxygenase n=1 Tax=Aspergillus cavernicola TaxID=176166 RepID=A0ABR4HW12_9EURO